MKASTNSSKIYPAEKMQENVFLNTPWKSFKYFLQQIDFALN